MDAYEKNINKSTITYNNLLLANSYNFETFDITKEYKDFKNMLITITSKRRTGKSVLLKDLCHKMKSWFQTAFVFSMTAHLQPDLFDFVDKENIVHGFSEEALINIWNQQEEAYKRFGKKNLPFVLLIFDDVISDPKFKRSNMLTQLAVMGRHINFCVIILSQNFKSIPPVVRVNVDCAIAFYLDSYDNRDEFSRCYLSTKNSKVGMAIFEKITKIPYQAIVCITSKITNNPEDYIKTYTAQLKVPNFSIGKTKKINRNFKAFMTSNHPDSGLVDTDFMPPIKDSS